MENQSQRFKESLKPEVYFHKLGVNIHLNTLNELFETFSIFIFELEMELKVTVVKLLKFSPMRY